VLYKGPGPASGGQGLTGRAWPNAQFQFARGPRSRPREQPCLLPEGERDRSANELPSSRIPHLALLSPMRIIITMVLVAARVAAARSSSSALPAGRRRLALAAAPAPCVARTPLAQRARSAAASPFTVVSWNVAGLRAAGRAEALAELVAAADPDVLLLQETKLQDQHVDAFRECLPGYASHWACSGPPGRKGYSGTAAFVADRHGAAPPVVTSGLGDATVDAANEGRALTLTFPELGGGLVVVGTYVPNSGAGLTRLGYRLDEWEPAMRAHIKSLGDRVVLAGDLNVAHLDADIWNAGAAHLKKQSGTTPEERAAFRVLLDDCDLVDPLVALHGVGQEGGAEGAFSYWSQRAKARPVNRGLRLDYTLCTGGLVPHAADILHDATAVSDHCPVLVTLDLGAEASSPGGR
jgi:exodeoxyribonuclease III